MNWINTLIGISIFSSGVLFGNWLSGLSLKKILSKINPLLLRAINKHTVENKIEVKKIKKSRNLRAVLEPNNELVIPRPKKKMKEWKDRTKIGKLLHRKK